MLDAQRPFTRCLLTGLGLDHRRVDALRDQRAPFPGGAPGVLQADRAIGADDAPGWCRTRREPCEQDEADLPGLAASRRVDIHGVGDAESEAGKAGVEHFDALALRCRWQGAKVPVGEQSAVGHRGAAPGAWATAGLQTRRALAQMRANVCTRYSPEDQVVEGFMRIFANVWKWVTMQPS